MKSTEPDDMYLADAGHVKKFDLSGQLQFAFHFCFTVLFSMHVVRLCREHMVLMFYIGGCYFGHADVLVLIVSSLSLRQYTSSFTEIEVQ